MNALIRIFACAGLMVGVVGCQTVKPKDYTLFRQHLPKSILVLPPLNESIEPNAPYGYMSTITQPLAEAGYYVFPVAVIDQFLKENGLPTPGEMHQIPLSKIEEVFGADAVLYITIREYGSKYHVVGTATIVSVSAKLIDVRTGTELWQRDLRTEYAPSRNGGLAELLVGAVVDQIVNAKMDSAHLVSRRATVSLINDPGQGLLTGPYGTPSTSSH